MRPIAKKGGITDLVVGTVSSPVEAIETVEIEMYSGQYFIFDLNRVKNIKINGKVGHQYEIVESNTVECTIPPSQENRQFKIVCRN